MLTRSSATSASATVDGVCFVPLVADRIKFNVQPQKFDALPYLDIFSALTFIDPDALRRRAPAVPAPYPRQQH